MQTNEQHLDLLKISRNICFSLSLVACKISNRFSCRHDIVLKKKVQDMIKSNISKLSNRWNKITDLWNDFGLLMEDERNKLYMNLILLADYNIATQD